MRNQKKERKFACILNDCIIGMSKILSSVVLLTMIPISLITAEIYGAKNLPSKQPKIIVVIGKSII